MKQNKEIVIFERPHDLSLYLLKHWTRIAQKTVQEQGRFTVALQGGESLREFCSKLSSLQDYTFWEHIYIFQTDQLHIPHNNSKHQFQFLKNNLIDYINIRSKNVFPIVTHTENPVYSSDQYEEDLTRFFELSVEDLPKFDCVVMGLNEIDHLKPMFDERAAGETLPMMGQYRVNGLDLVSIHPGVLAEAEHIIFVGTGKEASLNASKMIEDWGKNQETIKNDPHLNKSFIFLLDSIAANELSQDYDHLDAEEGVILFNKK